MVKRREAVLQLLCLYWPNTWDSPQPPQDEGFAIAFGPLYLFASLFLCTYQFSLSRGCSSIVVCCCRWFLVCLFASIQSTHTHPPTRTHTTVHTRSHKGLNHPTLSCLAFARIQRAGPFLPSLTSCLPCLQSSPLIVCTISFVATWPAVSPIYQPIGPVLATAPGFSDFSDLPRCGPSFVYVYLLIQFGYIVCLQSQTCCCLSSSCSSTSGLPRPFF